MIDFLKILDMLDWNMPRQIQTEGVSLAKEVEDITPFIQPLTPRHNKNVWDNCAIIIADRSDEELAPHLVELMEWLQDMNWPGAIRIMRRLQEYSERDIICKAINFSLEKADLENNKVWEENLRSIL